MTTEEIKVFSGDSVLAFAERTIKRLWVAVILLIVLLVATNAMWIWNEAQCVDEAVAVIQSNDDGHNNYIGNDGDIHNGDDPYDFDDGDVNDGNTDYRD